MAYITVLIVNQNFFSELFSFHFKCQVHFRSEGASCECCQSLQAYNCVL